MIEGKKEMGLMEMKMMLYPKHDKHVAWSRNQVQDSSEVECMHQGPPRRHPPG